MTANIISSLEQVKSAAANLGQLSAQLRNQILLNLAQRIDAASAAIIAANQLDLLQMAKSDPRYDRLLLTHERITGIAQDLRKVAGLASPLGKVIEQRTLANDLELTKISVPLGVVAVIYEARPNVTIDVFSLGFKSGNAVVLKGGKEAEHSNRIFVSLIQDTLTEYKLSPDVVFLMPPSAKRSMIY